MAESTGQAQKKPGFFARIGRYFSEVKGELKKVVWPTRKQVFNNTGIVIVICIIAAIFVFLLDIAASGLVKLFLSLVA